MRMLTAERERMIRHQWAIGGALKSEEVQDLLAEMDRLRDGLAKAHLEIAEWDGERNQLREKLAVAVDGLEKSCMCEHFPYPENDKCDACEALSKIRPK